MPLKNIRPKTMPKQSLPSVAERVVDLVEDAGPVEIELPAEERIDPAGGNELLDHRPGTLDTWR